MQKSFYVLFGLLSLVLCANAQTYTLAEGSSCTVSGTSNISDWTATVNEMDLSVQLAESFFQEGRVKQGGQVQAASMTIAVKSIDGGKGETMNANIYEAFEEPRHPQIVFQLQNGKVVSVSDKRFTVEIEGVLAMHGQRKIISLTLAGKQDDNGQLNFMGRQTLKMTEFGMEPPTAMFGAIEAGDEVVIEFNLKLQAA